MRDSCKALPASRAKDGAFLKEGSDEQSFLLQEPLVVVVVVVVSAMAQGIVDDI